MNQNTAFRQTTARNSLISSSGTLSQLAQDFQAAALVLGEPLSSDDAQTSATIAFISAMAEQLVDLDRKAGAFLKTLGTAPQAPQATAQKSHRPQQGHKPPARAMKSDPNDPYSAFDDMFSG